MMKRIALLVISGAVMLGIAACQKDSVIGDPVTASGDEDLAGETVTVGETSGSLQKLFVLNEGQMGTNNATLDFLRFSDGKYVKNAYSQMNPAISGGLGDVGNAIAVHGDLLWIVVNNSGLVEVVNPEDERHLASIALPNPRSIAFDDRYAYVTSWTGVQESSNPKGQVFRVDLQTFKRKGSVEVGLQPEGIAFSGGKLYVANSGGLSSQTAPDYAYDRTVSIIDTDLFKVTGTVDVAPNLKDVYADGQGNIFVTTLGNFADVHSGVYVFPASDPSRVARVEPVLWEGYVTCAALCGDTLYCIGTDTEYDWTAAHEYTLWSVKASSDPEGEVETAVYALEVTASVPYGMAVTERFLYLGDAGDYVNPGRVICYAMNGTYPERWRVQAGVNPGHFVIW